jgi:class 3 adenylate cyclase
MRRRWRHYAICALIAIVSAAAARTLSESRFFHLLNLKALDLQFVLRGRQPVSQIMLIVVDDRALGKISDLRLFWHPYYAEAIQAAADGGAKVIGLDLAFPVPVKKWEPGYDGLLADAVVSSPIPNVVGYVPALNTNQRTDPVPVNMFAAALGLSGYANLTSDADDFVRRQELMEDSGDAPAKSLAFRVTEKFLGADAVRRDGRLTLAGAAIPGRTIYINYAGPPGTFPHVSLYDVIAAAKAGNRDQLRTWLSGKIVLIGSDTVDDRYATPFYTMFAGPRWTTAGVEIHANTIHTLLHGVYLLDVSEGPRIGALIAAAALTAFIAATTSAGTASAWLVMEALAIIAGTQILFRGGWILPLAEILVAATLCLIAAIIYRFSTAEERGNLFRRAISLFVGKQLAATLEDTQTIRLTGLRQTVTILFTDIRGFTAFTERVSEEQGPEVVVKLLNEYLGAMTALIVAHRGHVNKFIGDGILAVFSDSDEGAVPGDHASRAVQCATAMVLTPGQFETGAGIHTGLAVIGNVGSADKMEYTVLGDTVNLASRIESLNKEFHTRLLMSGATQSLLGSAIATTYLAEAPVKGKAAPIPLFTVTELTPAHV